MVIRANKTGVIVIQLENIYTDHLCYCYYQVGCDTDMIYISKSYKTFRNQGLVNTDKGTNKHGKNNKSLVAAKSGLSSLFLGT
jgi:hypothetical protein